MLVFKNLLRRKARSFLSLLGIAIGVAAIIAFNAISKGFRASLNKYVDAQLVLILRNAATAEFSRIKMADVDRIRREIGGITEISATGFMVTTPRDVKGRMPTLLLFGRDPKERAIRKYRTSDLKGRLIEKDDEVMLGFQASEKLGKNLGDTIELFEGRPFKIVGIYSAGVSFETIGAIVTTRVIQEQMDMKDTITLGFIYLDDSRRTDEVKRQIEERFPHLSAVKSGSFAENFDNLQYIDWFVWIVSLVSVIVGGLGVLNTMLMSVSERTREIGTLRAVGWGRAKVLHLILSEAMTISVVGGLFGLLVGWLGAEFLIRFAPSGFLSTTYSPLVFVEAMVVALALGFVGALYPAVAASRLSPIEALKYE